MTHARGEVHAAFDTSLNIYTRKCNEMTARTYIGGSHSYADPAAWSPTGAPQAGDGLTIRGGTLTATGLDIENEGILLGRFDVAPTLLNLSATTLGVATPINSVSEYQAVVIDTAGNVVNRGKIAELFGTLDINVGTPGHASMFSNTGSITAPAGIGSTIININVAQASTFDSSNELASSGLVAAPLRGTLNISGAGAFNNNGMMVTDGGTINVNTTGSLTSSDEIYANGPTGVINITFGAKTLSNAGLIGAGPDATINITAATSTGAVENSDAMISYGNMAIKAAVHQTPSATLGLIDGKMVLQGAVDGGTVVISSGMLEFGGGSKPGFIGPASARSFTSPIDFAGPGTLQFDGASNLSDVLQGDQLLVYGRTTPQAHPTQIADIHLTGGAYSASSFSIGGSTIHYLPPAVG